MNDAYPGVKIVTAWVDEKLNEQKYIVPGLGGKSSLSLSFPSFPLIVSRTLSLFAVLHCRMKY